MKSNLLFIFLLLFELVSAQTKLSIPDYIINNTTLVVGSFDSVINGKVTHWTTSGTGFFFDFNLPSGNTIATIVTHAHVIQQMDTCYFTFNILGEKSIEYGKTVTIPIAMKKYGKIRYHPDADLAVIPVTPIFQEIYNRYHTDVAYSPYDQNMLLLDTNERKMDAIVDVLMTGYPNTYYDYKK